MQDSLVTSVYFQSAVYTLNKPDFLTEMKPIFDEYVARQTAVREINNIYPAIMTENMAFDPRLNGFSTYVASTAWNILNAQGYKMDDKITFFESMWGQEHHKRSNMEQHIHNNGVQIVGFYFIECPEDCSRVIVHDPRAGKNQINMPESDMNKITYASSIIGFKPEAGMLLFTNSWLPHSFSRNGSKKPMKFIHFNINVMIAPTALVAKEEVTVI